MKLRIRGNSIRLRLGQSEVRRLNTDGLVEESVNFGILPAEHLTYALIASADAKVSARFAEGRIAVSVPKDIIRQWAGSDQVGIEANQAELRILIEKDFECVDGGAGEPQDDAFPSPVCKR